MGTLTSTLIIMLYEAPLFFFFFFFLGTAAQNKILTGDDFLIHGEKAHQLWCFFFQSFRVSWVIPKTVIDLLFIWGNIRQIFGT